MAKAKKKSSNQIANNAKARFDYQIEESFEAGIALQGWEVKSLREGKAQLRDSYVRILNDEAWLIGLLITPLISASTHIQTDATRTRKLLLHRKQINYLQGKIEQQGYTLIALSLYWSKGNVKVNIGLAKGRKNHDKRHLIKDRDWKRDQARTLSNSLKYS